MEDDGLIIEEVGPWSTEKYSLIGNYAAIFATGMKRKWDCRVYLDLFSGPGLARNRDTSKLVAASPLRALGIRDKFDRYIFCESNVEKMDALGRRVERLFPEIDVRYIPGDVNSCVEKIVVSVPKGSSDYKVLTFCLVDPYSLENLAFDTIKQISNLYVDFLVLIPSYMDANRNVETYLSSGNAIVDRFLGISSWRNDWKEIDQRRWTFGFFILNQFASSMEVLGFKMCDKEDIHLARNKRNAPLYHLAFFCRHERGLDFFKKAKKASSSQHTFSF